MTRHLVVAIGTAILTIAALGFLPRSFNVTDADGASPNPMRWRVSSPRAGSRDELRIDSRESLDHAFASRVIGVFDSSGVPMTGAVSFSDDDGVWRFAPTQPWREGAALRVQRELEDAKPYSVRIAVVSSVRTRHSWLSAHRPPPAISFSP